MEMSRACLASAQVVRAGMRDTVSVAPSSRRDTERVLLAPALEQPQTTRSLRDARYAYRGSRVGEASNPGPPRSASPAELEGTDEAGAFADYVGNPANAQEHQSARNDGSAAPGTDTRAPAAPSIDPPAPAPSSPLLAGDTLQYPSGESAPVPSGFVTPPEELEIVEVEPQRELASDIEHYDFRNVFRRDHEGQIGFAAKRSAGWRYKAEQCTALHAAAASCIWGAQQPCSALGLTRVPNAVPACQTPGRTRHLETNAES